MRRAHRMPFGAEVESDRVRFALWAPDAGRVDVAVSGGGGRERFSAMERKAGGFFSLVTEAARPGSRYRFRIDGGLQVPDPASRAQVDDVHGPSLVVEPLSYDWRDRAWRGRPWQEAVVYEINVGAFTPEGTFDGARARLRELRELGVTALELMPVADFPGRRGWGYDGTLPFAPDRTYGAPDDLKRLVDEAHGLGLMVLLDVVYNHFGPEGNYLGVYARRFFDESRETPWGAAIAFDGPDGATVRSFFVHNALYWLEEYHFDGLRLDAVHAIRDRSEPGFLRELAAAVAEGPGSDRHIHLVLENDDNAAHLLRPSAPERRDLYAAQWNDDVHHAMHVLLTGEDDGYYADYAEDPIASLGRSLLEGFAYQGERSRYRGAPRGEGTAGLEPTAFVGFLQNHDQVGNRAFGERLELLAPEDAVEAATALLLLSPAVPLLFMGEEWGAREPFLFFCDFGEELRESVTRGRRREFAGFPAFSDPAALERIPDPCAESTFARSRLGWDARARPEARRRLALTRELLAVRREWLVPRLRGARGTGLLRLGPRALRASFELGDGASWTLAANLGPEGVVGAPPLEGEVVYALRGGTPRGGLGPYAVAAALGPAG